MEPDDNDFDEAAEEAWVEEQRSYAADYLQREGVQHGVIGEWPAWHLPPYLAILEVESAVFPGYVGWWVICGDCPTDYISFDEANHAREAMRQFADRWAEAASHMLRGEPPPSIVLGPPEEWPQLGDLLQRRAKLLREFAEKDSLWDDLET